METTAEFVQMTGLAVINVTLWTLRVALTARGRRVAGSLTAGVDAFVYIVAFSRVAADLTQLHNLVGYALGVTLGTLLGMSLDERLSVGRPPGSRISRRHARPSLLTRQPDGSIS